MKKIRLIALVTVVLMAGIGISISSSATKNKPCTACTWTSAYSMQNSEAAGESLKTFKEANKTNILIQNEELHEQCSQQWCVYYYTVSYTTAGNCLRNGN